MSTHSNINIQSFLASLALSLAPACGGEANDETGFTTAPGTETTASTSTAETGATGSSGTDDATTATPTSGGSTSSGSVDDTGSTTSMGETGETSTGETGDTSTSTSTSTSTGETGDASTSTGDASTGDADAGVTIYDIQEQKIARDTLVSVEGVIVTGVALDLGGFFVQEPGGGEYSGIWVSVGDGPDIARLAVNDEVDVTGTTSEAEPRTAIDASAGAVTPTGVQGLVVDPVKKPITMLTNPGEAEMWEGVLIFIEAQPLTVLGLLDARAFKLGGNNTAIAVDGLLYAVPADAVAFPGFSTGATFTKIAGVVNKIDDNSSAGSPRGARSTSSATCSRDARRERSPRGTGVADERRDGVVVGWKRCSPRSCNVVASAAGVAAGASISRGRA